MACMVAIVHPELGSTGKGTTMPEIENFQEYARHCFDVARSSDFLEEDIALEAFELLIANTYDQFAAHALGVSL